MMECSFVIFAFCAIVTLCMSGDLSEKIKGGLPARKGDFSFAVRILKDGDFVCSGMLVSRSWVLTRKGCIGKETKNYKIVLSSRVTRQVRYIQTDAKNDEIILARLNKKVRRTKDKVRPFDRFIWKDGEERVTDCKTIGFSGDKTDLKEIGTKMKWSKKCGEFNKAASFCFDANQGSICTEDNGSPIICKSGRSNDNKWYLVGLTSVEKGCQQSNIEAVRLTSFKKYIFKILKDKGGNGGGNGGGNEGGSGKKENLELGEKCDDNAQCLSLRCDTICKNNCSQGLYNFNKTCTECLDAQDCAGARPIVIGECIICPLGGPECPTRPMSLFGWTIQIYNQDQCKGITKGFFSTDQQCYQQLIDGIKPLALTFDNNNCIAYPRNCRLRLIKSVGKKMSVNRCT